MVNYTITSELIPILHVLEHEIRADGKIERSEEKAREMAISLARDRKWIQGNATNKEIISDLCRGYETTQKLADSYTLKEKYQEEKRKNPLILVPDYKRFLDAIALARERSLDVLKAEAIRRGEEKYFNFSQAQTIFTQKLIYFSERNLLAAFGLLFRSQLEQLTEAEDKEKNGAYYRENHDITQRLIGHATIRALVNDRGIDRFESEIMDAIFQTLTNNPNLKTANHRRTALSQTQRLEDCLGLHEYLQRMSKYGAGLFSSKSQSSAGVIRETAELIAEPDRKKSYELTEGLKYIQQMKQELGTIQKSGIALMALTLKYFAHKPIYAQSILRELMISQIDLPRKEIETEISKIENPPDHQVIVESLDNRTQTANALPIIYSNLIARFDKEKEERRTQKTNIEQVVTLVDQI